MSHDFAVAIPARGSPPRTGRGAVALALLGLAACHRDPAVPTPAVDLAAVPAEQIVGRVLQECHGTIVGMDRCAARVTLANGDELHVFAQLPDRLRVQFDDGGVQLLVDGTAQRLVAGTEVHTDLSPAARTRLLALRTLLDCAALGPLHRSIGCTRTGERTFALAQPGSLPWTMTLAPGRLLVERLAGPAGTVTIAEHLRTSATWIVRAASIEPLGQCRIRFDTVDVQWGNALFGLATDAVASGDPTAPTTEPPTGATSLGPTGPVGATMTFGTPAQPRVPTLESSRASRWVVVDDPTDWQQRAVVVQEHMRKLAAHGQVIAGFPGLIQDGERARLVLPFRAGRDQVPFPPPADWDVREIDAGRTLVVYPPTGDLDQRRAEGERMLRAALAAQGLSADGPVLVQPYLHLDEGAPSAAALAAPVVRVSVSVR